VAAIWTMGEMLVEIMRPKAGMHLYEPGEFLFSPSLHTW